MLSSGLSWLFGFSGGGKFGTVFLYCLAAFVFVCKCSPRGCRGFSLPVLGLILDGVLSYFLIPFDAGETENTGRNWRFTGASKNKQNKSRREHIFVDFDTRKEKSDYVYVLWFKSDKKRVKKKKQIFKTRKN